MRIAVTMAVCFLAALLGASFAPRWWNWGVSSLSAMPPWGRVLLAAVGATAVVLAARPRGAKVLAWPFRKRSARSRVAMLCVFAVPVFWALRSHTYTGDAFLSVGRTGHGAVYNTNALSNYYLHAVCAAVRGFGGDALDAVRWGAYLMGAAYVALAAVAAKLIGRTRSRQGAAFGLMCTVGVVQIFCGRVEIYAPLATATLAYLCLGLAALRGKVRWEIAALTLGVGIGLHAMMAALGVSLVYLAVVSTWRGKRKVVSALLALLKAAGLTLLPVALTAALIFFHVYHGSWDDVRQDTKRLGSFAEPSELFTPVGAGEDEGGYALLSTRHAIDVLNQAVLTCPAALLGLVLWLGWRGGGGKLPTCATAGRFLLLAFIPLAAYTATAFADDFRGDWDAFCIFGIPLTLLSALMLVSMGSPVGSVAARCFAAAGAVSLLAWSLENRPLRPVSENHMRQHVALIQLNRGDYARCAESVRRLREAGGDESDGEILLAMGDVLTVRELDAVRARSAEGVRVIPRMCAHARSAQERFGRVLRKRHPSECAEAFRILESLKRLTERHCAPRLP